MGLFDFFSKRRCRSTPPAANSNEVPSLHYLFAHIALRQIALDRVLGVLGMLSGDQSKKFIASLLSTLSEDLKHPAPFTADDIFIHPLRLGNYPAAIIEMPVPRETAEAYFTAMIALIDLEEPPPADLTTIPARYITLEKGVSLDKKPRTVLGEWTESSHLNFGTGPDPTLAGFEAAINQLLRHRDS